MAYRTSGIVDLSTLAPKPVVPGGSFVVELTETNFDATVQKSVRHPVVIEFHSARAPEAEALSGALRELATEAGGKYLLARVDVDAQPQIVSAFGVQAVPTVVGVVGGQVAPLFQGTKTKQDAAVMIDKLLQVAAASGVVGKADAVAPAVDENGEPPHDPRFDAADAALEKGDFALAVAEFDKILQTTPNDPVASAGKAQAGLLGRVQRLDAQAVVTQIQAEPNVVENQLNAADLEMISGRFPAAFDRLIAVIRQADGPERDRVRVRLLELFETVGASDPSVLKARRDLATALY